MLTNIKINEVLEEKFNRYEIVYGHELRDENGNTGLMFFIYNDDRSFSLSFIFEYEYLQNMDKDNLSFHIDSELRKTTNFDRIEGFEYHFYYNNNNDNGVITLDRLM